MKDEINSSNKLQLTGEIRPQIPIIGIGGAGLNLTDSIVKRLSTYKIQYNTMGIDINQKELDKNSMIETKYLIDDRQSTNKQYLRGNSIAREKQDILRQRISSYLASLKVDNEVVFVLLGGGGTGVGVAIEVIDILISMGKRPVPFLMLPSEDENTRIKFNTAVALYKFSYAPSDRCFDLVTICIDNNLFISKNKNNSISSTLAGINERVAATIADIIISTELTSHGYNSELNDFIEIFREIKGIGTLTYMHHTEDDSIDNIFRDNLMMANSFECDIFSGTRSYIFVQSAEAQLTSMEYRSFLNQFNNIDIFPKLNEAGKDKFIAIRGVTTGIKLPDRIRDLIKFAEDVRVNLLTKENNNSMQGKGNPRINRLKGDADIEVIDDENGGDNA